MRKADHLVCEKHEYKTGQDALTCSTAPLQSDQYQIDQHLRGPFFKKEDSVSSLFTIRIQDIFRLGSPIILNDGPRARACQLSTWTVNL